MNRIISFLIYGYVYCLYVYFFLIKILNRKSFIQTPYMSKMFDDRVLGVKRKKENKLEK